MNNTGGEPERGERETGRGSLSHSPRHRLTPSLCRPPVSPSPGAVAGTLLAFVIALGEYVASVLVFVPANRPVSIAIASELRDFNLGTAAAYGVILIGIIGVSMIVAARLERLNRGWSD